MIKSFKIDRRIIGTARSPIAGKRMIEGQFIAVNEYRPRLKRLCERPKTHPQEKLC
jgi:hypothetical protein